MDDTNRALLVAGVVERAANFHDSLAEQRVTDFSAPPDGRDQLIATNRMIALFEQVGETIERACWKRDE